MIICIKEVGFCRCSDFTIYIDDGWNRHTTTIQELSFSNEEATFIVMKFADVTSIKNNQKLLRSKFFPKKPRNVPDIWAFYRFIERFNKKELLILWSLLASAPKVKLWRWRKLNKMVGISSICCNKKKCSTIEKIFIIEFFLVLSNKCFKYNYVSMTLFLDHTLYIYI